MDLLAGLAPATNLLLMYLEGIAVLHIEAVWVVCGLDSLSIEQETNALDILSLPVAKRIHEFLKLCRSLDFEEDFVVVVRDLDVQVLRLAGVFGFVHIGRSTLGHSEELLFKDL